jgi:hypothetical protein
MNWAWASSLDHIWDSPSVPMWLTLAAAGFFAVLMLVTLVRAEKSVANGALTVITLLAVGVAVAATIRGFGLPGSPANSTAQPPAMAATPALSCIDDLAGDTVLTACEKTLFASAESTAAAVSYAASQITRLTALGDVATVNRNLTPEMEALRRAIERDRYGLMAYVLVARDHCTPQACPAFSSLANSRQIMTNMDDRVYEGLVMRYSGSWGAQPATPAIAAVPSGALAALPPTAGAAAPTGKPTTMIDFPSASSTPPVSIMTPEPGAPGSAAPPPRAGAPAAGTPAPRQATAPPPANAAPPPAPKKQPAPKSARAPTPITPTPITPPSSPPPAQGTAADND